MKNLFDTLNKKLLAGAILLILSVGLIVSLTSSSDVVNPNKDTLLPPDAGIKYAALYNIADINDLIDGNESVLRNIETDIAAFARITRPEFEDENTLIGFTFEDESTQAGEELVLYGRYYGVKDRIKVVLTSHGRGVYTLSITNLEDGTNIDKELAMNGVRNKFIVSLPIEKTNYSIRYDLNRDQILVTFYDGYTKKDVNEVEETLDAGLGDELDTVTYTINRIGVVSLNQVRQNLINPIPVP